jgi:hypothetical protein
MRNRPYVFLIVALLVSVLACTITGGGTPDPHAIETSVAATLQALSGGPSGGGPETTPTGTLPPEAPPGATVTPTATATLPPPPHLRVVYVDAGNVYLIDTAGPATQLTFAGGVGSVRISDDGAVIAYTRRNAPDQPSGLSAINSDGSGDHIVITGAQINALYPLGDALYHDISSDLRFVPGTHHILLNTREAFEGPGLIKNKDLLMADLDAATWSTIFARGSGGDAYPSPDGLRMAIVRPVSISLANIDGTGYMPDILTFPFILTYSEYALYPPVLWSADSSQAGVLIPSPEQLSPDPFATIYHIDPATGVTTAFGPYSAQFMFPRAYLSPDLIHYSYSLPITDTTSSLHIANTVDSASLHLADGNNHSVLSFSPDGAWFIYDQGDPRSFYVGSLGGGTIGVAPLVMNPKWINATHFVYLTRSGGTWSINLGGSDGSSTLLASGTGQVYNFDADE